MTKEPIKAQAIVDLIQKGIWEVRVWNDDHVRTYTLNAKTDNDAALEGIRLFVEEMECLQHDDG